MGGCLPTRTPGAVDSRLGEHALYGGRARRDPGCTARPRRSCAPWRARRASACRRCRRCGRRWKVHADLDADVKAIAERRALRLGFAVAVNDIPSRTSRSGRPGWRDCTERAVTTANSPREVQAYLELRERRPLRSQHLLVMVDQVDHHHLEDPRNRTRTAASALTDFGPRSCACRLERRDVVLVTPSRRASSRWMQCLSRIALQTDGSPRHSHGQIYPPA